MSVYKISKGNHYADGLNFQPVFGKSKAEYLVTFRQSCLYDLGNSNQGDINKLCGWGHLDHRANSVRFGWRCVGDMIELCGYLHVGSSWFGKQPHQVYLFDPKLLIYPERKYQLVINMKEVSEHTEYFMGVIDPNTSLYLGKITIKRPKLSWFQKAIGTKNYFYFGGDETAPHDIYAEIIEH